MDPNVFLLALATWREAEGELLSTKEAVAWSIRNRVLSPGWWGDSWWSVILKPYQYSSFNPNEARAVKFPGEHAAAWLDCLVVANRVYTPDPKIEPAAIADPTRGAVSYFDMSLDTNPPAWAAKMVHTIDLGRMHFYKVA